MELKPTKPLSGFIELLPVQQRFVDECTRRMQEILRVAGFEYIDLPAIERAEVLTDETDWSETATQMFLFQKGDTKMGLRYDGTVGLARYVAGNMNNLTFPCRLTQFSKRYRGERPQKGRYREFYQLDLDILGLGGLSVNYDAEIVKLMSNIYDSIPEIVGDYVINIGSRPFWNAFTKYLNLSEEQTDNTFVLIDKKTKLDASDFQSGLIEIVGEDKAKQIISVFEKGYESLNGKTPELNDAISELSEFISLLKSMGVSRAKLNMSTMRGLGYYDGIVYEAESLSYPEIGSIGGGGRYGNLVGRFSKTAVIGSGCAIGTNRMLLTALESGRIDLSDFEKPIDVAVLVMGAGQVPYAMSILAALRDAKIVTVPYLDADKKFKNQIEFADKINSKFSIIIGEDEVKNQKLTVKNMDTGDQQNMTLSCAIEMLKIAK
ncbi:MAG TPA: histidine--tRNA ligase [Alphaproteobacteria bacterium]|nr:histidine--tRNA ligase [Alphaproteobacteria bacterium]